MRCSRSGHDREAPTRSARQTHSGTAADELQRFVACETTGTRCTRSRRECRIDAIDVERQIDLVLTEFREEGIHAFRPLADFPFTSRDDPDAVRLAVVEIGWRVEWAANADAQHASWIDQAILDGADEG